MYPPKTNSGIHSGHGHTTIAWRRRIPLLAALLLPLAQPVLAQVKVYDLHLQPKKFDLYTDPYNGNQIHIGGFSGLFPIPGKPNHFYTITDRGPAPDYIASAGPPAITLKTWAIPEFGPHLIEFRLEPSGKAKLEKISPLLRPDGVEITGLPTTNPMTDVPYDFNLNRLPYDEDSIDAEGITIDPWGNFWVCEEYKPSVAMLAPDGKVLMRLVPAGTVVGTEVVPTYGVLPGVLAKRRSNRGFEGIAASSAGILYAAVQRPLNNPNRAAADANGNTRIVAIDLNVLLNQASGPLVRQYLYQMPPITPATPLSCTLSDLFSTGPTKLLVPERGTDKLFEINVANATDITPLEGANGVLLPILGNPVAPGQTLEQLDPDELVAAGIVPVSKKVILPSLTAIDPLLEKVEGISVVGNKIYLTYDNDFNVWEVASTPTNPHPDGPFVQLELIGTNYPKVFVVPMP